MSEGTIEDRVARFLLQYRVTPHTTTGCPPAELLFGRNLRTRLDLIKPDLARSVEKRQCKQKENHDQKSRTPRFAVKDNVYVRNFSGRTSWLPGYILRPSGPCSFMAKLLDGRVVRRHTDHLRMRTIELEKLAQEETRDDTYLEFDSDDGTDPRRPTEQGNSPEMCT